MIGAIWAMVTLQMSDEPGRGKGGAERTEGVGQRAVHRDGEGLDQADQQRGDESSRQRAQSADHHDHEQDRAEQSGHVRLRHQRGSGDHAGDRGERGADAEHQHEDAADIVAEMAHHVRMRQRGLHDQPDPSLLQDDQKSDEDDDRDQQHEHLVGGIIGGEDRKGRKIQQRRHAEIDRALAPDDLDDFLDREGQAEGEQQFGDMAVLVHAAQAVALDGGADRAGQQRRDQERGPEAEPAADLKSEERAEHVEAGMREVQHAEHAEDDGEPARHQKQQHAVQHTVERGHDDQFKHGAPPGE